MQCFRWTGSTKIGENAHKISDAVSSVFDAEWFYVLNPNLEFVLMWNVAAIKKDLWTIRRLRSPKIDSLHSKWLMWMPRGPSSSSETLKPKWMRAEPAAAQHIKMFTLIDIVWPYSAEPFHFNASLRPSSAWSKCKQLAGKLRIASHKRVRWREEKTNTWISS